MRQINLKMPEEVLEQLDLKASRLGLNRTSYIKLIAMNKVTIKLSGTKNERHPSSL